MVLENHKERRYLSAKVCKPANPMPSHWSPPGPGKAKLNCDAAYIEETGETWGGAVARDHQGHVFLSAGRRLARCCSVEEAEGAAAVMGLTEFARYFNGQLILETDNASLGRGLQSKQTCRPSYHAVLTDAKKLLSAFSSSEISVVTRAKNKMAHELAAIAKRTGDFSMLADVPLDARNVMRDECVTPMV